MEVLVVAYVGAVVVVVMVVVVVVVITVMVAITALLVAVTWSLHSLARQLVYHTFVVVLTPVNM